MDSGFRRSDGPTPKTPERKHHPLPASSLPRSFSDIPIFPSFQFSRHSGESRNLHAALDSGFRQSDGPTPNHRKEPPPLAGITLAPQFFRHSNLPRHFNFPRHSGESRNLHAAMDTGFRQDDGPTPPRSMPQNPQAPPPSSPSPAHPLRRPRPGNPPGSGRTPSPPPPQRPRPTRPNPQFRPLRKSPPK